MASPAWHRSVGLAWGRHGWPDSFGSGVKQRNVGPGGQEVNGNGKRETSDKPGGLGWPRGSRRMERPTGMRNLGVERQEPELTWIFLQAGRCPGLLLLQERESETRYGIDPPSSRIRKHLLIKVLFMTLWSLRTVEWWGTSLHLSSVVAQRVNLKNPPGGGL